MRKKTFQRIANLLLASTLVMSTVACGKGTVEDESKSSVIESSSASVSSSVVATDNTEVKDTPIYPLDTDVELSVWAGNNLGLASTYNSWEESPRHSGLYEHTGVKIDWKFLVKGADEKQDYNLLWVNKELPNIVYYKIPAATGADYIDEGLIWDLTDYVEEYAPNYYEYITREENLRELKATTTLDGRFYMIPCFVESSYNLTYIGPIIRQDWLDECGLEQPVTIADWENVLVTFKDKYNAKLSFRWNYAVNTGFFASGFDALGFLSGVALNDDNKMVLPEMTEEYHEMIKVIADWWSKGLIDEDCVTLDNNAVRTKALNNETGVIFTTMSQFTNIINDAASQNSTANWVPASYARTAKDAPTSIVNLSTNTRATGYGAVITTSTSEEELKIALQWLDYAFTEEGNMYMNFGDEDVSLEYDADGNPKFTTLVTEDELGHVKYSFATGSCFGIQKAALVESKNNPIVAEAPNLWTENTKAMAHKMPPITLTSEEAEKKDSIANALNTYMSEEIIKFCSGDRDLSEWNDFQNTLKEKMRAEEYVAIYQAAYERYLAE